MTRGHITSNITYTSAGTGTGDSSRVITTEWQFPVYDDYCDCHERCPCCGKKKRSLNPPYIVTCSN